MIMMWSFAIAASLGFKVGITVKVTNTKIKSLSIPIVKVRSFIGMVKLEALVFALHQQEQKVILFKGELMVKLDDLLLAHLNYYRVMRLEGGHRLR